MDTPQQERADPDISTARLILNSTQKEEKEKYWALALLLFVVTVSFTWLCYRSANGVHRTEMAVFSHGLYLFSTLIGLYWCLRVLYRAYPSDPETIDRRYLLSWLMVGLALTILGISEFCQLIAVLLFAHILTTPSLADLGYTLFYGLLVASQFLLPLKRGGEGPRLSLILDVLITGLCLFGISWFFLFHTVNVLALAPLQMGVLISYTAWDIVLLLTGIFLYRRIEPMMRSSFWVLCLGFLALSWANVGRIHVIMLGEPTFGRPALDPFWALGFLVPGFAAMHQYYSLVRQVYTARIFQSGHLTHRLTSRRIFQHASFLQNIVIYIPVILLLALTISHQSNNSDALTRFLNTLCALVIPLCMTRYLLTMYQSQKLFQEKEEHRADAELLRQVTGRMSEVIELDLLLNEIVKLGASELGFETAALVLINDYDRPLDAQTRLLARAALPDNPQVADWTVTGEMIPYCTALMGKDIQVRWCEAPIHPPTSVHKWHIEQEVQTSLFVPLRYQGKIQGSMAFSLRTLRSFSEHELFLARSFAKEAANALAHAHFYELARENALFAQGMSNVAARLNSVIATGMGPGNEIHQLICNEGANALRADLAVLYVQNTFGQFVPQAALIGEGDSLTFPQEWPALTSEDYAMLVPMASQATLLSILEAYPWKSRHDLFDKTFFAPSERSKQEKLPFSEKTVQAAAMLHNAAQSLSQTPEMRVPHRPVAPLTRSLSLHEALRQRFVQTAILAPLFIHQTPIGLLVLARNHRPDMPPKSAFAASDLPHAQDFSGQASIAFTNARLYQQLRNAHQRMQELDRLKDQFMITASHELRTPLTAVQGYLELLEHYQDDLPTEQKLEFIQKASRGCEELVLLLNNVMDASYLEMEAGIRSTHLKSVNVQEVVQSVLDLIMPQIMQEQREIQMRIPPHLVVKAEPTRLRQVLRNLISNALKYSEAGTPLRFSAHPSFEESSAITLSVTDRGKGIPLEDQARLFQRFVRLESDLNSTVRGSGLGLYISRRLIEAMYGKIWIESSGQPGDGTTFHIQLPIG